MYRPTIPALPHVPTPSLPRVSVPTPAAVARTAHRAIPHVRKALPYAIVVAELAVLLAPVVAPALAPVHAAQLLMAARWLGVALALAA